MPSACSRVCSNVRSFPSPIGYVSALLVPLLIAGCGNTGASAFPPACPRTGILADAADLTRYRPGAAGQDLTDMVLDGRITGVSGSCGRDGSRVVKVEVTAALTLVRGPAAHGQSSDVPLFIAVSRAGQLVDKQVYRVVPNFAPNSDTLRISSDPVTISLPVSPSRLASDYDLVVGFQLTQDELALNRRRGPR